MRILYIGSAQKSIVLFTSLFVGAICRSSSHRIRSSLLSQVMPPGRNECNNKDSPESTSLEIVPPIILSSSAAIAICSRGGAVDDDPQRRRGREYYDDGKRLPPPRGREDGDRPPGGGDVRRGNGPSRPQQGDRDGRVRGYNRYDVDTDRSSRNREYDRSNRSREYKYEKRGNYDEWDRGGERKPRNYKSIDSDRSSSSSTVMDYGKKKKWFSMKKDETKSSPNSIDEEKQTEFNPQSTATIPPPPPPPPSNDALSSSVEINPAETERIPINYYFPTAEAAAEERRTSDTKVEDPLISTDTNDAPDIPYLDAEEVEFSAKEGDRRRRRRGGYDDDDARERTRVSARRDAVTIFMATKRGATKVRISSMIVGAALGAFIGKSLMNDPITMSIAMASLLFVTGFLRNDYGELSRALGLAFVLTLSRTSSVRKDYPTLVHIKVMIRQGPRKPFPPVEDGDSPWKYEPIYRDDPEFKMTYALLAMALVGSFCGGNIPIIPAWMGGILGAVLFASMTTGANARGDLGRTMGMRVVGLLQLVLAINSDLRILAKAATVGGLIFDKFMIFDRKHRIKDRFVSIVMWGYEKVSRTAEQVKEEMGDERPEKSRRPPPERRRYD